MINSLLFIADILLVNTLMVAVTKYLGEIGLTVWTAVATILANLTVGKQVDILGINATLGNVLFASVFCAVELCVERYGVESGKKASLVSLLANGALVMAELNARLFAPNAWDSVSGAMDTLFATSARSAIASVICFFIATRVDVHIYDAFRRKFNKSYWLRNIAPSILANCGENFLFFLIGFYGDMSFVECLQVALSCCVLEGLIGIAELPFAKMCKDVHEAK